MKIIEIRGGERKKIIKRFSNSMQMTYNFNAEPMAEGEKLSGIVEVSGSNFLLPKPSVEEQLRPVNSVEKGMWDSFYSVYVVPDNDVKIILQGSNINGIWFYIIVALVIVAVASSLFFNFS